MTVSIETPDGDRREWPDDPDSAEDPPPAETEDVPCDYACSESIETRRERDDLREQLDQFVRQYGTLADLGAAVVATTTGDWQRTPVADALAALGEYLDHACDSDPCPVCETSREMEQRWTIERLQRAESEREAWAETDHLARLAWRDLRAAAAVVVDHWETGDLAAAVRGLDTALHALAHATGGADEPDEDPDGDVS